MELRHLRHLVALAEEGSFTRAASKVHTVQSGLSASIQDLERELDCRLVERTTRKLAFTELGNVFLAHARTTLASLDEGIKQVQSDQGVLRGHLRLGILQSLAPYLDLPIVLTKFRDAYPSVEVSVKAVSTDAVPALVRSGELDLSFHLLVDKAKWPGIQVLPYAKDALVAVCSSHHPLASLKGVTLGKLAREPFVDVTPERALRKIVDKAFASHGLSRKTSFEVSDIPTAMQFVDRALGVAIVPDALARSLEASGKIAVLKLKVTHRPLPTWRIAVVMKSRRSARRKAISIPERFLQILSDLE